MLQRGFGAIAWPPERRCRYGISGHDQLSFDDRLANVLDRGDGLPFVLVAEMHYRPVMHAEDKGRPIAAEANSES